MTQDLKSQTLNDMAARIEQLEAEIARLREEYQNAIFALEYWAREARVCGKHAAWIDGPFEQGENEVLRHRALLKGQGK